ncbi:hypothetical protein ACH49_19710 [Streptomyces leeuwenhoekii]|uniref:Uncharacterized protein n=1 Tax=Streptomyces leeuwenhoekii TaxID=1437453 RepID=A0ABR5HVS2_STRLW|nr:hypothetical protein [Streptomyces leeuwenhoekii]KMS77714.1 hypothetical protein ACH49_19710 [Streptomyces leeuwenhoekii]
MKPSPALELLPPEPPPYRDLTYQQRAGWACCWCGTSLLRAGGVPAGRARGRSGTHVLDVDVYACPTPCRPSMPRQTTPDRPVGH